MWGIIPAAGVGSRIQPLAFSKELLPVGSRQEGDLERPRAVSDYLVERLVIGGATHICFVISPRKSDILEYYGSGAHGASACYVVQQKPAGLCDAVFSAIPLVQPHETVMVGLPDTIWFPEDALTRLPDAQFSFLLFPVVEPERFDAVLTGSGGRINEIRVKSKTAGSNWIWGAFKMPGSVFHDLHRLWCSRGKRDEYIGTLVNQYLADGGVAWGVPAGSFYLDVGTLDGYREAVRYLDAKRESAPPSIEEAHQLWEP